MAILKKATLVLLLSGSFGVLCAQSVDTIIDNYVNFIGGKANWSKVQTMASTGTYNYGGMQFPFEAMAKTPNLYRYKVSSNGKYFEQAFDGSKGWRIDVFKGETEKTMLSGEEAKAMANEADVNLESPFINYKTKGYKATLEGDASVDSIDCFKVKFISSANDTATCFFSKKNFSLIKKEALSKNAELDKSMLDTYYSDYRSVGGIKLPFKMASKIGDQTILTVLINEVKLNIPVADTSFRP